MITAVPYDFLTHNFIIETKNPRYGSPIAKLLLLIMPKPRKKLPIEDMHCPVWASRVPNEKLDVEPSLIKEKMQCIREDLEKDITSLISRLGGSPLIFDESRFTIIKNFLFLSHLIGEINILFATVWRYSFDEETWKRIAPSLAATIQDFEKMRDNGEGLIQSGAELNSFYMKGLMKNFHQFLIWFDSHLEDRVLEVTELTPFEIRIIDMLSCCPTVDFQLTLTKSNRDSRFCALNATYKILNLQSVFDVPNFDKVSSAKNAKESKLVKFIRDCVRCDNASYLQNIINSLSASECQLVAESDDNKLKKMRDLCVKYEKVLNELYHLPVHDSYTTTIGKKRYFQDSYKRELHSDNNVAVLVNVKIPVLSDQYLPLILCKSKMNSSPEPLELQKDIKSSISSLKEFNLSFGGPMKPEIRITLLCDTGLGKNPSKVLLVGGYDRSNNFYISQKWKTAETQEAICEK